MENVRFGLTNLLAKQVIKSFLQLSLVSRLSCQSVDNPVSFVSPLSLLSLVILGSLVSIVGLCSLVSILSLVSLDYLDSCQSSIFVMIQRSSFLTITDSTASFVPLRSSCLKQLDLCKRGIFIVP